MPHLVALISAEANLGKSTDRSAYIPEKFTLRSADRQLAAPVSNLLAAAYIRS